MPKRDVRPDGRPVVLFDGVCNLCNGLVAWIIRRDRRRRFLFAPLQSPAGRRLQDEYGLAHGPLDTLILVEGRRAYRRSSAVLRILRRLGPPYNVAGLLLAVPQPLRDAAYGFIARRRYRWFGRRNECMVPGPEVRSRFLVD
jgi:predicted DCC family thiol-disulfide oxidoreductase YuxK